MVVSFACLLIGDARVAQAWALLPNAGATCFKPPFVIPIFHICTRPDTRYVAARCVFCMTGKVVMPLHAADGCTFLSDQGCLALTWILGASSSSALLAQRVCTFCHADSKSLWCLRMPALQLLSFWTE